MGEGAKAILVIALIALALGCLTFGVKTLKGAGKTEQVVVEQQQAVKAAKTETKNARANAVTSKKVASATATDKAKAAAALKEITNAANSHPPRDCLDADGLRRYNDPLGDAAAAGGRGLPSLVPARPADVDVRLGVSAAGEPRGLDGGAAGLRAPTQRAGGAGEETPRISAASEGLK
jgi:hypothetical protein